MDFRNALDLMKQGYKVKLPSWAGYWCFDADADAIEIHCKDGTVLFDCTQRLLYTLENTLSNDWIVVGDVDTPIPKGIFFGFGDAIRLLKQGFKVCRKGWNGKAQYIELATNIGYVSAEGDIVNCEHKAIGSAAIAFVGTSGVQIGWLASQADMLADDWCFFEEIVKTSCACEENYYTCDCESNCNCRDTCDNGSNARNDDSK